MKVKLYSAPWCSGCKVVKKALVEQNVEFQEVDITTKDGGQELKALGISSIPVTVIDFGGNSSATYVGSLPETIKKILEDIVD